jgi:hypothetical protein
MGHQVTIDWERPAPRGGWQLLRRLPATLEPLSRTALPPRGGHAVKAPALLGITTRDRAIVNGRTYPVVSVEPADAGNVLVTLAVPDRAAPGAPAARPPSEACRVRLVSDSGAEWANVWADVAGDVVTLRHDYDFTVRAGWTVVFNRGGRVLTVQGVNGRELTCTGTKE